MQGIADDYDKKKLVKAFKKVMVLGEERIRGRGRVDDGTRESRSRAWDERARRELGKPSAAWSTRKARLL